MLFKIVHYDGSIGTSIYLAGAFNDDGLPETFRRDLETLIFNSYFAKAFWPLYERHRVQSESMNGEVKTDILDDYQYHLQQMVLEKEPLKYLEKFLE